MSKKDDNRDVWETVMEVAPTAVGAVAGGVIGRKLAKKRTFKGDWAYKGHRAEPTKDLSDNLRSQADHLDYGGARVTRGGQDISSEYSRKYRDQARRVDRMRAENVAIAGLGAAAGGVAGDWAAKEAKQYEIRKRRK